MSRFLIVRGQDLVLLGLGLTGFKLVAGGTTPVVEATVNKARFVVTFPPQHIGEETTSPGAYPSSSVMLPSTGQAVPVWASRLAGASRIAFEVATGTRIPLSVDGVLSAMAEAMSAPAASLAGPQDTMLEIPWGLLFAPVSGTADGPVKCGLSATPVASSAGVVGLWRARVLCTGEALGLKTVGVRTDAATDPVPQKMPLAPADRSSITNAARTSPAGVERLELTTLGGSLSARGMWDGLFWRHEASLGRDMAVQLVRNGILYPFGQPAVFVSITERLMEEGSAKPVAALRKQNYLLVTEQVRTTDASQLRAFPFHATEITEHRFDEIDTPVWKYYAGAQADIPTLSRQFEQAKANVRNLQPPLEQRMRAAGWRPDPVYGFNFDTDWHEFSRLNPQYNNYKRAFEKMQDASLALATAEWWAQQSPAPVCFKPTRNGRPVMFPVRLANAAASANIATPLVFVADVKLPAPPSTAFFDSLQHPAIAKIAADLLGGSGLDINLPALTLDMIGNATRAPADLHEVHGLLISTVGVSQPRLASFRAALPALRTLLGEPGLAPVKLAFTTEYLQSGEAADVVFKMADATERIVVDFTKKADRAGGLVAPQMAADAISRKYGPVQAAALVASAETLDPAKLFGAGATILGFKITDLIGQVKAPPTVTTQPGADGTPEVTMTWPPESLKLKGYPPFAPGLNSTLNLVVRNSSSGVVSTSTVTDFALELPPKAIGDKRLLRLAVQALTFTQKNGSEPQVKIDGLKAEFLGPMKLLKDLQDKVDLGERRPRSRSAPGASPPATPFRSLRSAQAPSCCATLSSAARWRFPSTAGRSRSE